mmetsp:Transcript_104551/g.301397  ORF Transcript_104551/g.301397 Transcript_104551/m.301397 type:complete len:206 (-) Transcript_104551:46-663(-)
MHVHQAGRSPGCRTGWPSLYMYTYLGGIYLPPSVVVAELVHRYMVVARSRRPVHGGGGNAHERATPLRHTYGSPIPWRTQWDPCTAVSLLPSFAYAPSVPARSAPVYQRRASTEREMSSTPCTSTSRPPCRSRESPAVRHGRSLSLPPQTTRRVGAKLRDTARWSVPSRRPIGARAGSPKPPRPGGVGSVLAGRVRRLAQPASRR